VAVRLLFSFNKIMKIDRDIVRQASNLIAIIAAFGFNLSSNIAPLNGLSIGEISNTLFQGVLITPANYAFAIWGVIYLGLISFGIYQALPAQRENPHLRRIGYLLVFSSFSQIIWVILFQFHLFALSLLAMLGILLSLAAIYLRLEIGRKSVSRSDKWLIDVPLGIYFGWISVATIVNVALVLYNLNWNGWGISGEWWTLILLLVGASVAATICIERSDIAYVGVFIWAFVAIGIRHLDKLIIAAGGVILAIALLLLLIIVLIQNPKSKIK
jgi:hypothetical protein